MKKPQYTRCTYYYPPKTHIADKTTIREFEKSIVRNTASRQWAIRTLNENKSKLSKDTIGHILRAKKHFNKNLRGTKRILKSILKKNQNKPFDIFEHCHPTTNDEDLAVVKNTPAAIEYITQMVTDYENSPLKGLFSWYAFIECDYATPDNPLLCVAVLDNPEGHSFRIDNRCHAYSGVYRRLAKEHSFKQFSLKTQ
jgi:hypothetical protein